MSSLKKKIDILEKDTEEIQVLAEKLINSAPVRWTSNIDMYLFAILPKELGEVQNEIRKKYSDWYNQVYLLIKKFLPHQLEEFQSKYKKTGGIFSTDISEIIDLKTGFRQKEGKKKVIQDFRECFSFQIAQLLSIKSIDLATKKEQREEANISLENLEDILSQTIYDYILKNPTIFQTKSRAITPQRKSEVKTRDNYICQICNETFVEEELEVDHIYPHSLGGSNRIENLMALCIPCNKDKGNRLDYYRSDEGRKKLILNIKLFTKNHPIISNFGDWLRKAGGTRTPASN